MKRIALAAALVLFASQAVAADTADLTVRADVKKVCSVNAATLTFPDYDPVAATQVDGLATVTVKCTSGTTWELILDANAGAMAGSGPGLNYALYSDSSRATPFPTTAAAQLDEQVADGDDQTTTIYGRIPGGQTAVQAGLHSDTVLMTIVY
jgi:spore coat protein U-like protein